jgi:hypothetical protein
LRISAGSAPAASHQLAGGVVDGGDVVGVEGVPQPEGVGEHADTDGEDRVVTAERVVLREHESEEDTQADDVQCDDERDHAGQRPPVPAVEAADESGQPRPVHRQLGLRHPVRPLSRSLGSVTFVQGDAGCKTWSRQRPAIMG